MNNYFFDLNDIYKERVNARFNAARFERMHFHRIKNLKDLTGRLPEDNEIFFIETTKSFNAFTFIVYLLKHAGIIESLFIATYSINDRILNSLLKKKESGLIGKIEIEISESIKFRMPKIAQRLDAHAQRNDLSVRYEWTHRKVTCIKTINGFYLVEGSGNYGENAMKEQYIFCKSMQAYEFRYNEIGKMGQ